MTRRILLVDADAFYVAVARLADPEGIGQEPLLIVGGTRESRGVVCSASYETRRFGVRSAMPIAQALRLCPRAVCVPIPRRACAAKSREIRAVLDRFAPVVEPASIDEWYLDLAGTETLYRGEPLAATAMRIRAAVLADIGMSVSIGGGSSKLIAKLAVERAKPRGSASASGVHVVEAGAEADFLGALELADIPLVGPRFQERLHHLGMRTVADALRHDLETLTAWLGPHEGRWLYERVRGMDAAPVTPRLEAKSISRDETFAADVGRDEELERELMRLVVRASADLRGDGLAARTVTVRIRDFDFTTRQASRTLPAPVVADRVIYVTARALLAKLRAARRAPARLLGVALSSLAAEPGAPQLELFAPEDGEAETDRDRALARTVDLLRAKFGSGVIVPGALR